MTLKRSKPTTSRLGGTGRREFDAMLFAHGIPVASGGKEGAAGVPGVPALNADQDPVKEHGRRVAGAAGVCECGAADGGSLFARRSRLAPSRRVA
jgi:hypothetical protein